jgi:hypothetical protein
VKLQSSSQRNTQYGYWIFTSTTERGHLDQTCDLCCPLFLDSRVGATASPRLVPLWQSSGRLEDDRKSDTIFGLGMSSIVLPTACASLTSSSLS